MPVMQKNKQTKKLRVKNTIKNFFFLKKKHKVVVRHFFFRFCSLLILTEFLVNSFLIFFFFFFFFLLVLNRIIQNSHCAFFFSPSLDHFVTGLKQTKNEVCKWAGFLNQFLRDFGKQTSAHMSNKTKTFLFNVHFSFFFF